MLCLSTQYIYIYLQMGAFNIQRTSSKWEKKTFVKNVNLMIYSKFCTYKRVRVILFWSIQCCINFSNNPCYVVRKDMDVNKHEILYNWVLNLKSSLQKFHYCHDLVNRYGISVNQNPTRSTNMTYHPFFTRVTRRVPLVDRELFILPVV
jgi:hypothetical protein